MVFTPFDGSMVQRMKGGKRRGRRRAGSFPALLGLLEDVAGVVFVEIVPLDRDGNPRFRVPIDVMVGTVTLENESEAFQFLDRFRSGIQSLSPFHFLLYTTLCNLSTGGLCKIV